MAKRVHSKILVLLLGSAVFLCAQRLTWYERWILLGKPRMITGIVVDPSGKPVAGRTSIIRT